MIMMIERKRRRIPKDKKKINKHQQEMNQSKRKQNELHSPSYSSIYTLRMMTQGPERGEIKGGDGGGRSP